jgi:hypothetical protein
VWRINATSSQSGEGVDDATWLYHLRRGDYAEWLRKMLKDEALAALADELGAGENVLAEESRRRMSKLITE